MKIKEIVEQAQKPELYEKGSSFMWTDSHISKQLLALHINPDIDVASRKKSTIKKSVDWILSQQRNENLRILDLGCGPGLYAEAFAGKGHRVTGVDISENSIEYATKSAQKNELEIDYQNSNYLDTDLGNEKYDLIVMIYTDFGVLLPSERETVLKNVYRALKKGGIFIFDVLNDADFESKLSPKSWEASDGGFWREGPYLALSESFLYHKQKVILSQHNIIDDNGDIETYRFWTHFFSQKDISQILVPKNFVNIEFYNKILPEGDMWNGDNVIFTKCQKF